MKGSKRQTDCNNNKNINEIKEVVVDMEKI